MNALFKNIPLNHLIFLCNLMYTDDILEEIQKFVLNKAIGLYTLNNIAEHCCLSDDDKICSFSGGKIINQFLEDIIIADTNKDIRINYHPLPQSNFRYNLTTQYPYSRPGFKVFNRQNPPQLRLLDVYKVYPYHEVIYAAVQSQKDNRSEPEMVNKISD